MVGGIVGGIAAISILVAALFFFRRRPMVASAGDGVSDPNAQSPQWSMFGQETATTSPQTSTSLISGFPARLGSRPIDLKA
jgi:hypothetical protein